jgi:uncharacterized SAM-binding protein YcdF (DUF218 family)
VIWRLVRSALALIGALVLTVTFTPAVKWITQPLLCPWTSAASGTLIVLTGPSNSFEGNPPTVVIGDSTYWRAMDAAYVWRHAQFRVLLLSGDSAEQTVKPLLTANGIPESSIVVENRANTTAENVQLSKPLLAGLPQPYVLITSDYHMYRASRCFARAGVQVQPLPAPDVLKRANSPLLRWNAFWTVAEEYAKVAYYRLRGWI